MSALTAIDKWLYATLTGDGTLTALLASAAAVYNPRAPQGATLPYVVFAAQVPGDVGTVEGHRVMVRAEYAVRAVVQAASYAGVTAIADRIDTLLHQAASASNADGTVLSCVRDQPLRAIETGPGGVEYRTAGGVYVIQGQGA